MATHCILGLDIGTGSIKAALGEIRDDTLILRALLKEPAHGLRKGVIVDIGEVSQTLSRVFGRVRKAARPALRNIYASLGTHHVKMQISRGIVAVSRADTEIYQEDIDRAIRASLAVTLAQNRMIVHQVPREYIVDGVPDIIDPLGLSGSRLEVNSLIIDAFAPHVKDLMRVVELGGGELSDLVLGPIIAARAALSKQQKELGTMLIDIGAGTTGMIVYEEGKLIGISVFPVGASNITNDLAIALKIPVAHAESIKLGAGYALQSEVGAREFVELAAFIPDAKGVLSRKLVAGVIEARLAEILEFVHTELKLLGKEGQLPGGAVVVGGGAKLPGITELMTRELRLSSQVGLPLSDGWRAEGREVEEALADPEFSTAIGLALWGFDKERKEAKGILGTGSIRRFFKNLLP